MGVPLTSYPAFLWLTVLSALLGSFQNGMIAAFASFVRMQRLPRSLMAHLFC